MRWPCQKAAANTCNTVMSKVMGMQVSEVACVECFLILIQAKTTLYVEVSVAQRTDTFSG